MSKTLKYSVPARASRFADLLEIRKKYFEEKSLYSLFRNVIPEVVFDFLREIGVFYKV